LLKDEVSSDLRFPAGIDLTIDGNGKHTLSRAGSLAAHTVASTVVFRDLIIEGSLRIATSTASKLRVESCTMAGQIRIQLGPATASVVIVDSFIQGSAAGFNPIRFEDADPSVTILRSRIRGGTANTAVYWSTITNDTLSISYSTIWHDSGGANNPFSRSGVQTPTWRGDHNAFNVDPDSFGWSTNLVAAGQQQSTFDVQSDY